MSTKFSSYPNGFDAGVLLKDLLNINAVPRRVIWVGNNAVVQVGEKGASDANKGTYYAPLSTIDAAVNLCGDSNATDGAHDVIMVRPNHTLSIANATTLVLDKANVHIIGLGTGEDRPIITFATDASAAIPITGANNSLVNFVLKCNIASQNHMIDIAAADVKIINCELREGTATGLSCITADTADNDSDRLLIKGCKFFVPTAGNGDNAIQLAKDFKQVRIEDCDIHGDFDLAAIEVPAGGNAQVDLIIKDCNITNLLTGVHAIEINGTGNTGKIINCYCVGDTLGTIVDAGGLEMFNVYEHDGTDQVNASLVGGSVASPTLVDDADNILGFDDNNNTFASTNVAANRDGSIIERLEDLEDVMPRVVTSATAVMANNDDIFTIAGGPILIEGLVSECMTNNDGTASTLQYEVDPTTGAAVTISAASASLASAVAGATVSLQGTALSTAALLNSSGGNLGMSANGLVAMAGVISLIIGVGSTTGTWRHHLRYRPLAAGVTVT